MINFLNIYYLKTGSEKQKRAFRVLSNHEILEKLAAFEPILVGTIPIEVDIETSDLDIICYMRDEQEFSNTLFSLFGKSKGFELSRNQKFGSVKAIFFIDDFEIEIFGQNIPTQKQHAYLHMLIEYRLLLKNGLDFRLKVIALKLEGYKTEPAFAEILGLKGNPYQELLKVRMD
ncbi:DUF4269 domain-containing protein [Mucilaginibacter polytrichastri]|uniref:DUF4269 domain-containing protein n=1 Tax=Mucilaginibacter polytrichastri TaxID=1302689 RepID=A0A1Q5ZS73_9SPHI|nr:DUF4269 domain-containing protein [Mucilaginibacter polytrichastri]OKS84615.1 hypothetical protein RG47T_0047 [Mucilaginibacter polytrichastri]SFT02298.1 protein of unknown function [Mucilaginibacter polytrichastri]